MPTQLHLPAQPGGAEEINAVVAIVRERGEVAYFASGVPVFMHREGDRVGQRVAAAQLMTLGLARQDELSQALAVDRSTLYRQQRKLTARGIVGVVDAKRGPRGPHRFTADKRERAGHLLAEGLSIRQVAERVGVTEGTIRHAVRRGELSREAAPGAPPVGPRVRSEQAAQAAGGIAVQRHTERGLARLGLLTGAAARWVAAGAGRDGGAGAAAPALLGLGLLGGGDQRYGTLKKAFY